MTKKCRTCGYEKPLSAFNSKGYNHKDAVQSSCTPCRVDYNRRRVAAIRAGEWAPSRHTKEWYRTPRATKSPSPNELYWAAGFFEGEASFRAGCRYTDVVVAQVQREPLERLRAMFGGKITLKQSPSFLARKNNKPAWIWRVHGTRARGVMMTVFSMMSPKRRQQIKGALAA